VGSEVGELMVCHISTAQLSNKVIVEEPEKFENEGKS